MSDYGLRQDGSPKGPGFLGEVADSQGNIMTEYSIGVEIDGEEVEIPSLVPGLSDDELTALKNQEMPDSVVEKAVEHARKRKSQGLPVFKEAGVNPWEKDWGIPPVEQEAPEVVETGVPKFDWGIESYIKEIPQKVKAAVNDYAFEGVFEKLIGAESAGRHFGKDGDLLTSSAGAKGVTQVMPDTGRDPGYGVKPLKDNTEEEYRRFGRDYLQAMLKHFKGDYRKAVAAYNAGPGSVEKAERLAKKKGGDFVEHFASAQVKETIPYMDKILGTTGGKFG